MQTNISEKPGGVAKLALSVDEFCAAYGVSRAYFYRLVKMGKGPRLMRIGRAVRISTDSAAAWARSMEAA